MSRFKLIAASLRPHHSLILLGLLGTVSFSSLASQAFAQTRPAAPEVGQREPSRIPLNRVHAQTNNSQMPTLVRNRVLLHAAQETGLPLQAFTVTQASAEVWPDGCLGIPNPAALCAAVLTSGWRVQLTHGDNIYVYRTDATASVIGAEHSSADGSLLPRLTASRVLDEIMRTSGLPLEQLDIVASEARTWDGCFGLPPTPDSMCTMIAIPGWRVIATAPGHVWVYHTNQDGTEIRLNEAASQHGNATVTPELIESGARPSEGEVEPNALVTVAKSGGIAGHTEKTVLYQDGRLIRYPHPGTADSQPVLLRRLSPSEVNAFIQQMQIAQIDRFEGLRYSAPAGTADYFSVTMLFGPYSMTQYDDTVTTQLPTQLQRVIQAWDTFANVR